MNVLLVLPHSLHVRNFVASGLVDMLAARGHRLTLVVPRGLVDATASDVSPLKARPVVLPIEPYTPQLWPLLQRLWPGSREYLPKRWLRRRFRVASYVERSSQSTYRHKVASRQTGRWQRIEVAIYYRQLLRRGYSIEKIGRAFEARWKPMASATRLIRECRPDVVVTSTFIQDAHDVEIAKAARLAGIPLLGFPVSWDTLTSKGAFLVPPDALMVWGEESARHAIEHHGFATDRVFVTGPPHFDVYGPTWAAEPREQFLYRHCIDQSKRVLLFAGTTVTYWADEPMQIRALSHLIATRELRDCVIWYRPHPRRKSDHVDEFRGLPGVHLDDARVAQRTVGFSTARSDLSHYRALIDACEGVITAFSTMIIEAALMGKPSRVVAFGLADGTVDGVVQHADYDHMRDVVATPGIELVKDMPQLIDSVRRLVHGDAGMYRNALQKRARQIAYAADGRARERIAERIEYVGAGGLRL